MAAGMTQPGLSDSQRYAPGGAQEARLGARGPEDCDEPQLPRAQRLPFADDGGFCPDLLLWVILGYVIPGWVSSSADLGEAGSKWGAP